MPATVTYCAAIEVGVALLAFGLVVPALGCGAVCFILLVKATAVDQRRERGNPTA